MDGDHPWFVTKLGKKEYLNPAVPNIGHCLNYKTLWSLGSFNPHSWGLLEVRKIYCAQQTRQGKTQGDRDCVFYI